MSGPRPPRTHLGGDEGQESTGSRISGKTEPRRTDPADVYTLEVERLASASGDGKEGRARESAA